MEDQLSFSNDVQITPDKQSAVVCETTLARVIRHWIAVNSSTIGKSDILIDNGPNILDNIRLTSRGTDWIAFTAVRHIDQASLFDRVLNRSPLRVILIVN